MQKWISLLVAGLFIAGCVTKTRISPVAGTQPDSGDWNWFCQKQFPKGQPSEKTVIPQELDVRSCDISAWDFTAYTADELADVLTFDNRTQFPPAEKLPKGFSPAKILKKGKNPGLHLGDLHHRGITGKGVSVALVDQNLLLDHEQYADRIRYYWQDNVYQQYPESVSSMHGPAVTSILAGNTVGVAPQADIYYWAGKFEKVEDTFSALPIADVLERILQYNYMLPQGKQIRVVSISRGFDEQDKGFAEFKKAVEKLEQENVAVFITNDVAALSRTHSLTDPDSADYCRPMTWWSKEEFSFYSSVQDPLIPMDYRVTASPTGVADYVHYAQGGLSWAVPYLAGLYALGAQVYPDLTKEVFMQTLLDTADPKRCTYLEQDFIARYPVNPTALIQRLQTLQAQP